MKTALIILMLIILSIFLGKIFIFPSNTVLHFQNNSNKVIDTAIIYIQSYKLSIYKIAPHTNIKRRVPKDSIASNKHDITIRVNLIDKAKSNFKGGVYYNDLSGLLNNSYTLTLDDNLKTVIR